MPSGDPATPARSKELQRSLGWRSGKGNRNQGADVHRVVIQGVQGVY